MTKLMPNNKKYLTNLNGFTLVELMVTVAIFAIVLTAVFAAFTSQFNSYQVQEDVAAIQADIRSSAELLTRDIRNAGYGSPLGVSAVAAATGSSIQLNLSTYSTLISTTANTVNGTSVVVGVLSTSGFIAGQRYNILDLRTRTVTMGSGATDTITAVGPGNTLTISGTILSGFSLNVGDVLATPGLSSTGYAPVQYSLVGNQLTRTDSLNPAPGMVLSDNVQNLTFSYLMKDGTTTSAPGNLGQIAAINYTINGGTANQISKLNGQKRTRTVSATVALRN